MAKRAGIPWELILSAELSGYYKPAEETYLRAVELLDVAPGRVMMVAAHEMDLAAASKAGLRTVYIRRPLKWGSDESGPTNSPTTQPRSLPTTSLTSPAFLMCETANPYRTPWLLRDTLQVE